MPADGEPQIAGAPQGEAEEQCDQHDLDGSDPVSRGCQMKSGKDDASDRRGRPEAESRGQGELDITRKADSSKSPTIRKPTPQEPELRTPAGESARPPGEYDRVIAIIAIMSESITKPHKAPVQTACPAPFAGKAVVGKTPPLKPPIMAVAMSTIPKLKASPVITFVLKSPCRNYAR